MTLDITKVLLIAKDEKDYILIKNLLLDVGKSQYLLEWEDNYHQVPTRVSNHGYGLCLLACPGAGDSAFKLFNVIRTYDRNLPVILLIHREEKPDQPFSQLGVSDYLYRNELNPALLGRSFRYVLEQSKM